VQTGEFHDMDTHKAGPTLWSALSGLSWDARVAVALMMASAASAMFCTAYIWNGGPVLLMV
jgi:hypothetical protein